MDKTADIDAEENREAFARRCFEMLIYKEEEFNFLGGKPVRVSYHLRCDINSCDDFIKLLKDEGVL